MMACEGGDLMLAVAACGWLSECRAAAQSLCVQAVGSDLGDL